MNLKLPKKDIQIVYKNKLLSRFMSHGQYFDFLKLQLERPIVKKTKTLKVTVEDLETHPMNLMIRWSMSRDLPNHKPFDHQKRIIITIENSGDVVSYIMPKFIKNKEAFACVSISKKNIVTPFEIEIFEYSNKKIKVINPRKININSKILLCTQILGHVQDAAKILQWSKINKSLNKWNLALPATKRTEITKSLLKDADIPVKKIIYDWSYAGGKDFRTGLEYKENFNKKESFSTVASFVAANMAICQKIVNGKYAVVSTNFRGESQIFKRINPNIITCGVSHTFLNGKLADRIKMHPNLPRLAKILKDVQSSLDTVPKRVAVLNGDVEHIDYYWKLCEEKIQALDCLIFRAFNLDSNIPSKLNGMQVVQIPMAIPDIKISKEKARKTISNIIGKKLNSDEKIIILSGESDDGSFKKRVREIFAFAQNNPRVHVLMPLNAEDEIISGFNMPQNVHAIGFRKDWRQIISGSDIFFIRGSWGEIIDFIFAKAVPIFSSPGTVLTDADLDTTQFLTQTSEERACNISLLVEALQVGGAQIDTINKLIIDLKNSKDKYSIDQAIEHALRPATAKEIRMALSKIPKSTRGCIGELHERLLRQRRIFSSEEIKKLRKKYWNRK